MESWRSWHSEVVSRTRNWCIDERDAADWVGQVIRVELLGTKIIINKIISFSMRAPKKLFFMS